MTPDGFSSDGYIIDQDRFSAYPYRTMSSSVNGCGWIAAYNLRRALGQAADFDEVRREMDAMFRLRLPGPTTMKVLYGYLKGYVPGLSLSRGRENARQSARASRAGILRYWEGREPHFAAYLRQSGENFRFLNVANGLEDFTADMDEFMRTRCARGHVAAITANEKDGF